LLAAPTTAQPHALVAQLIISSVPNPHLTDSRHDVCGRALLQDAVEQYTSGGGRLKDVVPSDPHSTSSTTSELQRKYRVHQAWLDTYLTREEQRCLFQLSVFRGSFNLGTATAVILSAAPLSAQQASSSGASTFSLISRLGNWVGAAVSSFSLSGAAAASSSAAEEVKVNKLLELLTDVCVLQRGTSSAGPQEERYSMHLLIRELAGDQLQSPQFAALHMEAQRKFAHLVLQMAEHLGVDPDTPPDEVEGVLKAANRIVADELQNMMQLPWVLGLPDLEEKIRGHYVMYTTSLLCIGLAKKGHVAVAKRIFKQFLAVAARVRGSLEELVVMARLEWVRMLKSYDSPAGAAAAARGLRDELLGDTRFGARHPNTLAAGRELAQVLLAGSDRDLEEAESIMRSVADVMVKGRDAEAADAVCELAAMLLSQGKVPEAEECMLMVDELGGAKGLAAYLWAGLMQNLGMGKQAAAVQPVQGGDGSWNWLAREREVEELLQKGQTQAALRVAEDVLREALERHGEGSIRAAGALRLKASVLLQEGDVSGPRAFEAAEDAARKALEINLVALDGEESHGSITVRKILAIALMRLRKFEEAAQMWRKAADWAEGAGSKDAAAQCMVHLAEALLRAGVWEEGVARSLAQFGVEGLGAGGSRSDWRPAAQLLEVRDVLVRAAGLQSERGQEDYRVRLVACMHAVAAALGKAGTQNLRAAAELCSVALDCVSKSRALRGSRDVSRNLEALHAELCYEMQRQGIALPGEQSEWDELL
jgi:tetratricopeptide (TPR) repeat protein